MKVYGAEEWIFVSTLSEHQEKKLRNNTVAISYHLFVLFCDCKETIEKL